jgi:hypothetical protein
MSGSAERRNEKLSIVLVENKMMRAISEMKN